MTTKTEAPAAAAAAPAEQKETKKDILVIGRISKAGKEYYQTALNLEGYTDEEKFVPVFLKKGVEKLNYKSMEKKVDKRGVVYTLYTIDQRNVFMPKDETDGKIKKAIVTK